MVTCTYSKILVVNRFTDAKTNFPYNDPVTAKKLSKFETLLDLHTPAAVILWK